MEKTEMVRVLEAVLLLAEGMPEEEVGRITSKFAVSCAKYIHGFLKSFKP